MWWNCSCVSPNIIDICDADNICNRYNSSGSITPTQESHKASPWRLTCLVAIRKHWELDDVPCSGYKLSVPHDWAAVGSYVFAMHMAHSVPWTVSVIDVDVYLHSHDCMWTSTTGASSMLAMILCLPCCSLHNNSTVMGIHHHALDGAPDKMPYNFLGPSHAINLLCRKDEQIENLCTQGFNSTCSLIIQNHQIESWKWFALAISEADIPHLHSLMSAALHDRSGVFGLLKRVDKAAQHVYLANGYQKADFEQAFLMWKLGGRSTANITFHTLGIPSIESARWHIQVSPITAFPGLPTQAEMESNISQCFLEWGDVPQITTIQWRVVGMTMPIDKLKIQPHLWWDPYTNMILGVCREHGRSCCLEFWTIVQAIYCMIVFNGNWFILHRRCNVFSST